LIAIDTNILVYARREETPHHVEARSLLERLATGVDTWALPWPCVYEFLRVVTHPRVFDPPTALDAALDDLESLFAAPSLTMLGEGPAHAGILRHTVDSGRTTGNLVHDAHIAALAIEHGVLELWTTDRDFARFSGLRIRNPFREWDVHGPVARYRASGQGGTRSRGRKRKTTRGSPARKRST
jgi:toxin-antitoxin system PIN domain toxin